MIREGDHLLLGPTFTGEFVDVAVTSLKRNRTPCRFIRAGSTATLALTGVERPLLRRVCTTSIWFQNMERYTFSVQ